MPIQQKLSQLFQAGSGPPRTELGSIADESARLVEVAKELLKIARGVEPENPELAEALSGPISQILESATTVSSSVIRLARAGN